MGETLDPDNLPEGMDTPIMRKAVGRLQYYKQDAHARALYESRLEYMMLEATRAETMRETRERLSRAKRERAQAKRERARAERERVRIAEKLSRSERERTQIEERLSRKEREHFEAKNELARMRALLTRKGIDLD
jgi:septal ring factor EnvC (AmiA/AmiB activator)